MLIRFMPARCHHRAGLTLIELLVVMAIIGILAGFVLMGTQSSRAAASRAGCANNLRQVGLGLQSHQAAHGIFPPQQPAPGNSLGSSFSYEGITWHVYILPFIEQAPLWNTAQTAFQKDPDPRSAAHSTLARTVISTYLCPADGRLTLPCVDPNGEPAGFTSYVGMVGPGSVFGRKLGVGPQAITDGLSSTIMVGERPPPDSFRLGWWYTTHDFTGPASVSDGEVPAQRGSNPYDGGPTCMAPPVPWPGSEGQRFYYFMPGSSANECDRLHYWSLHPGGANFLFADGSVRFLGYGAAPRLQALATIAGGETATD